MNNKRSKYFEENGILVKGLVFKDATISKDFSVGSDGVLGIYSTQDNKIEIIDFRDKKLCIINSSFGDRVVYPWIYPKIKKPVEAVLMDLDGTSVHSEQFWIWIIEQVMKKITKSNKFEFAGEDEPFVSGHSVSEHLNYAINKYAPGSSLENAREEYYRITEYEMNEIMEGRGKKGAFKPAPGLKEFLLALKEHGIKTGLVTSGLYNKAMPEIISAFRVLEMGDPEEFFDAIITAGYRTRKGVVGTLGEMCLKPHPWLYSETAKIALGIKDDSKVVGIEDSCAGLISIRLAGYEVLGMQGGNIKKGGLENLCKKNVKNFDEVLEYLVIS